MKTRKVNRPNLIIVLLDHKCLEQIQITLPYRETYVHLIISMSKFSLNLTTSPTIQWDTYLMKSKFILYWLCNDNYSR